MEPDGGSAAQVARTTALEADNARLRRLLDQRDTPAELRHRLGTTLGLLREIIRRSAEPREEAADYARHLEDRLDALMRMHAAIDRRGEVDLHGAFADELMAYTVHEGGRLRLSGPVILLQPRAAQVLGLVIHELAVNAVEHGAVGIKGGRIDVAWAFDGGEPNLPLTLVWKETGLTGLSEPSRSGFGTEVLCEMIQHDLSAQSCLAYEPDGLRYTLRFPLPAHIGCVGLTEPVEGD